MDVINKGDESLLNDLGDKTHDVTKGLRALELKDHECINYPRLKVRSIVESVILTY